MLSKNSAILIKFESKITKTSQFLIGNSKVNKQQDIL